MVDQSFRRLGDLEKYYVARHAIRMLNCVAITCRYCVPTHLVGPENTGKLKSAFEKAIAHTIEKHPHLQAGIDDEEGQSPKWKRLEMLDLSRHIEWISSTSAVAGGHDELLLETIDKLHNTSWSNLDQHPGWKTVNIASNDANFIDVIFAWHHSYGDGTSGVIFQRTLHESLLAEATSPTASKPKVDGMLQPPQDSTLPPAVHDVVRFTRSISYTLKLVWSEVLCPSFLASAPPEHPPWEGGPINISPNITRLSLIDLDRSQLQSVLQKCREHQTTLTGLLHALVLTSLIRIVPEDEAQAFSSCTPISLRKFIHVPDSSSDIGFNSHAVDPNNILGNFVTTVSHSYGSDDVSCLRSRTGDAEGINKIMWEIAGRVKGELVAKMSQLPADDSVSLLHLVSDWKAWFYKLASKPRQHTWEVSNVGVMETSSPTLTNATKEWRIERAIFSQGANPTGAAISINAIAVKGGRLCLTTCWQEGVVETKLVKSLTSDLQRWLIGIGKDGRLDL